MIYKVYVKYKNGDVDVYDSTEDKNEAVASVKEAEGNPLYVNAWYVRTE